MQFFRLGGKKNVKAIGICSWPVSVPAFPVTMLPPINLPPGPAHITSSVKPLGLP